MTSPIPNRAQPTGVSPAPSLTVKGHFDLDENRLFGPIALTVPSGKWTCLLGKSGVGKSTLLHCMLGLETGGTFVGELRADDGEDLATRVSYMA